MVSGELNFQTLKVKFYLKIKNKDKLNFIKKTNKYLIKIKFTFLHLINLNINCCNKNNYRKRRKEQFIEVYKNKLSLCLNLCIDFSLFCLNY